jgi:hypothetical protein
MPQLHFANSNFPFPHPKTNILKKPKQIAAINQPARTNKKILIIEYTTPLFTIKLPTTNTKIKRTGKSIHINLNLAKLTSVANNVKITKKLENL